MYAAFAALSLWPLSAQEGERLLDVDAGTTTTICKEEVDNSRVAATRAPMLALAATMTGFSTYLVSFVMRDFCPCCAVSAAISLALFATALASRAVKRTASAVRIVAGGLGVAEAADVVSFAWGRSACRGKIRIDTIGDEE